MDQDETAAQDAADVELDRRLAEPEPGAPRWLLVAAFVLAWLAVMGGVGGTLIYAQRADGRAERAGRTVCTQAEALGTLAEAFDDTVDLLSGDTRAIAESELRRPIDAAADVAAETRRSFARCRPDPAG